MADLVFDIAKGAAAEKVRDGATAGGILLLKTAQVDATLKRYATLDAILTAGGGTVNVEANFTNYARKTGLTVTLTVDNTTNDQAFLQLAEQTWTAAGGATNNTLAKLIVFYQESAADTGRIPLTAHDFVLTTDGTDVLTNGLNQATGFYKAT